MGAPIYGSRRQVAARKILRPVPQSWLHALPYPSLLEASVLERPNYGHCMHNATQLAGRLGVSVIEFGVVGGNGLVAACPGDRA
jgi:hypothetical protein